MKKRVLITGGCGFIGINAAIIFKSKGWRVDILDNLSRANTSNNLEWMKTNSIFENFFELDIIESEIIENLLKRNRYELIIHLAAQVAVTTSLKDPMKDFKTNVIGTINLLEALRRHTPNTVFIYASTNKVYGNLGDFPLYEEDNLYVPKLTKGVSENSRLDFHTPYGCSKGAGDQYVLDYGRSFGLKTFIFRQSCIYGKFQRGVEDQGWLAWFALARLTNYPVKIFGNGKQVRDLLYVEDLVEAYLKLYDLHENINEKVFNIGGGYTNSASVKNALHIIDKKLNINEEIKYEPERPGDQKYFVSDNTLISETLKWQPKIKMSEGIDLMLSWMKENMS